MRSESFEFLSKDGKTSIHAVKWIPDSGKYKAILLIAHGMVEYIGRYEDFAKFMTDNEYMVVGNDHLGHGESVISQNDWGYFMEKNPADALIEDMHTLRKMVQQENPGVPYFMMGHSMGSYMLRKYLTIYNKDLRGAVFSGTGYIPKIKTSLGLFVTKFFKVFRGSRYRSKFIRNLTYDKPYRKYDLKCKDLTNCWLTRDVEIVKSYFSNPKCSFVFTLNGYQALFETVQYDCIQENVDKVPNKLPIFLFSGDQDPVGNLGVGVKRVYDMFERSGKTDLTYKLYEGMRHEPLQEIGKQQVYADLLAWLNVRIDT